MPVQDTIANLISFNGYMEEQREKCGIKFKSLFLLVKNCGVNATKSLCSDLKPFLFKRNTRPQKLQVTIILDRLYFIPKLDRIRG